MRKGSKATWTPEERAARGQAISAGMKALPPPVEDQARKAASIHAGILSLGFTPLEDTHRSKEPIGVQCPMGHVFRRSFQYLSKSQVCPECLREQEVLRRQAALELRIHDTGMHITEPVVPKATMVQLRCANGHAFRRKIHHIMHEQVVREGSPPVLRYLQA